MVHFYQTQQGVTIYKGKDKFENEQLILYHFPQDVWFHVDDFSSAHVYLRMPPGMSFQSIPEELLEQCAQLVRQNSIQGKKKEQVDVVYTPADNLLKRVQHEVGAVSYKDNSKVRYLKHVRRNRVLVKALEKSFRQEYPDLKEQLQRHLNQQARARAKKVKQEKVELKALQKQRQLKKEEQSYERMWDQQVRQRNKEDSDFM